jgi:hypothetical protein
MLSPFSQKSRISEGCNKYVELVGGEPNDFIASKYFMIPENPKICQILQAGMML